MIRGLVVAMAMAACAQGAELEDPQLAAPLVLHETEPAVTICGMAFDPAPELLAATEAAAERWSAATGCDVRVEPGGVPVRITSPEERGGHRAAAVRDRATGDWSVGVAPGLLPWTAETMLVHELGHVLGCLEHTTGGLMAERFELYTPIDASALACVCTAIACAVFAPER
jgi:hypothetical protein